MAFIKKTLSKITRSSVAYIGAASLTALLAPTKVALASDRQTCFNVAASVQSMFMQSGIDSFTARHHTQAAGRFIASAKLGISSEYLAATNLGYPKMDRPYYLSTVELSKTMLGLEKSKRQTILVIDAMDLRFIPSMQQSSDLIVVASTDGELTSQQINSVISAAKSLDLRLFVIWNGASDSVAFSSIAKASGGSLISTSTIEENCG